jgi:isopenicillin N synthase-like dioxygenase
MCRANMATATFTTLPILPLSKALDPTTKPAFLEDLRSALLNVGFLYLSETGLPDTLVQDVIAECKQFFEALPQEEKERIEMKNEKSFLGWSRVSAICLYNRPCSVHWNGRNVDSLWSVYWYLAFRHMRGLYAIMRKRRRGKGYAMLKRERPPYATRCKSQREKEEGKSYKYRHEREKET